MIERGQFSPAFLDQIRERLPLTEIVKDSIRLTRAGAKSWKGCCPFHGEKTPSFHVYDDHFHCFGCGIHGDIITYIQKSQNLSFPDAVRHLAGHAGLEIPVQSQEETAAGEGRKRLKAVLDEASVFYEQRLRSRGSILAQEYLLSRGVNREDVGRFRLGYAPRGDGLLDYLTQKGFKAADIVAAGLAKADDKGKIREFFFDRIMFPIMDKTGAVVSFGGRAIAEEVTPKYINGPESQIFKKSRQLYGLHLARQAAGKGKAIIMVEGYLDVIAMHRVGLQTAVAPLGTAVTPEHLEAAWQVSPYVVGLFDGDKPGRSAALKLCRTGLQKIAASRFLSVGLLDGGDDPDSLIKKGEQGLVTINTAMEGIIPAEQFIIDELAAAADCRSASGRAAFRVAALDVARSVEDPTVGLEVSRYVTARVKEILEPVPGHVAPVPEAMASVMVGLVLKEPDLLGVREDVFRGLLFDGVVGKIRDDICSWWVADRPADKSRLVAILAANRTLAEAKTCVTAMEAHIGTRVKCGLPGELAAAFDDIVAKVACPIWHPMKIPGTGWSCKSSRSGGKNEPSNF